ncbi:hypothetical protein HAZT_HAZT007953 [Hyalella azteca]|uniref:Uncharacterized protein n=1 Tax=Hyalella azteca TaxID=294128 RepID=A0A6A0GPT0_HYAAZ|nr:hypothetical protein HAZT_HAZT007953 [Hyalella azteca]
MLPLVFVRRIRHTTNATERLKYQAVLSLLSCFAGGVFMGTCILDLFPDTQAQIKTVLKHYPVQGGAFPVAEFIVVYGFLMVLTIEQIVLWFKEKDLEVQDPATSRLLSGSVDSGLQARQSLQREHSLGGITDRPDFTASVRSNNSVFSGSVSSYGAIGRPADSIDVTSEVEIHNHDMTVLEGVSLHSPLRSIMLLLALSLHSIFEGLAVGLQETINNVVALFVIVIFHKGIIAFSLGLNMVQSRLNVCNIVLSNVFFCITAPLGIALGVGISSMHESPTIALISGALQGLACGTFLYVTFFEVLPHEMNTGHHRLWKNVCVIVGFSVVCGMMYIDPEQRREPNLK